MTSQDDWLRTIAAHFCDAPTMDRVVEPMLMDLGFEYGEAVRLKQPWKRRCIRLAGYVALIKVLIICGWGRVIQGRGRWTTDDHVALGRALGTSVAAVFGVTLLLVLPPLLRAASLMDSGLSWVPSIGWPILYLIPQAIPLAVPVGLTLGVLLAFRSGPVSRHVKNAVLFLAMICAVGSFVTMAWIIPSTNQAFRGFVFRHLESRPLDRDPLAQPVKGLPELTLGELRQRMASPLRGGSSVNDAAFRYYQIWALPCAIVVLVVFALAVVTKSRVGRGSVWLVAVYAYLIYYALMFVGRAYVLSGTLSPFSGAWLANLVFATASAAVLRTGFRSLGSVRG